MTNDVTVIVPAFNASRTIAEAIASIRSQECVAEIVVVDDGSIDDTAAIADRLADRVIRASHRGIAATRNEGVRVAQTEYVAFLDADDQWTPGRLSLQHGILEANPRAGAVVGYTRFSSWDPHTDRWVTHERSQFLYSLGAALIRRTVFDTVGLFDESLECSEDVDWFLRVRDAGVQILTHPDVVQYARRHGANTTFRRDLRDLQFLEVLKRSLDRRRATSRT